MKIRLLSLINIALIPYVWWKFPREAGDYSRRSLRCLATGKGDLATPDTPPDA